jgi:hypothetical protein
MSIGVVELVVLAVCGVGVLIGAAAIAVYFIQRDRDS